MSLSYNQIKALAHYTQTSVMQGPPDTQSMSFGSEMVKGIQTGAILTIQLYALAAAFAEGVPTEQMKRDFRFPPELAERAHERLAATVQQIILGVADEPAPESNPFLKPPADFDPNSTETAGFKKFSNFMMALRQGMESAYAQANEDEFPEAVKDRELFFAGMDFLAGSLVIALSEITKKPQRICAESINVPERVIEQLEVALAEEEANG